MLLGLLDLQSLHKHACDACCPDAGLVIECTHAVCWQTELGYLAIAGKSVLSSMLPAERTNALQHACFSPPS